MKKKRRRFVPPRRRKQIFMAKAMVVLLLAALLVAGIDCRVRPIIKSLAQSQAVVLSTKLIDEAVSSCMEEQNIDYAYLMKIAKDENETVTSIQANALNINMLKAKISTDISQKIQEIKHKAVKIPIGTLIGGDLFSGRGPSITFYISLSGNVRTELASSFYEAGINQTLHTISLNIKTAIYIICPGYNTSTETDTNMVVAETVIVGNVPDTYNYINTPNLDDYVANYTTID